jgi:hypothetical protein
VTWSGVVHFEPPAVSHITVWNAPSEAEGVKAARRCAARMAMRVVSVRSSKELQPGDQTPEGLVLSLDAR